MNTNQEVERLLDNIVLLPDGAQLELLKALLEMHAEDLGLYTRDDGAFLGKIAE